MEILLYLRDINPEIDLSLTLKETILNLSSSLLVSVYHRFFSWKESEFSLYFSLHRESVSSFLSGRKSFPQGEEAIRKLIFEFLHNYSIPLSSNLATLLKNKEGEIRKIGFSKNVSLYFLFDGEKFCVSHPNFPYLNELFDWKKDSPSHLPIIYDPLLWKELAQKASLLLFDKRETLKTLQIYFNLSSLRGIDLITSFGDTFYYIEGRNRIRIPLQSINFHKMKFKFSNLLFPFDLWLPLEEETLPPLNSLGTFPQLFNESDIIYDENEFLYLETNQLLLKENETYVAKYLLDGKETYNSFLFLGSNEHSTCIFFNPETAKRTLNFRKSIQYTSRGKLKKVNSQLIAEACSAFFQVWINGPACSFFSTWMARYRNDEEVYSSLLKLAPDSFQRIQESTMIPLFSFIPRTKYGHPKTQMRHLFEEIAYTPISTSPNGLNIMSRVPHLGLIEDVYLPVFLYRRSLNFDPLYDIVPNEVNPLTYTLDEESQLLLYTPYAYVFRNKISAYYELSKKKNPQFFSDYLLDPYLVRISELFEIEAHEWLQLQNEEGSEKSNFETYDLDGPLFELALSLGIKCLIFTSSMELEKMETQIMDLRLRKESLSSIVKIE